MFKNLKLKNRLLISVCGVALAAFALISIWVSQKASSMMVENAKKESLSMAQQYASQVQAQMNASLDDVQNLGYTFETLYENKVTDRNLYNELLKNCTEKNTMFFSVWSILEPAILGGKTENERFVCAWKKENKQVKLSTISGYNNEKENPSYFEAKQTLQKIVVNPYFLGNKLLSRIVIPLIDKKGVFLGVVGIDIELSSFQEMIKKLKPFEVGVSAIFANDGKVIAHFDSTRIGQQMQETEKDMVGDNITLFAGNIQKNSTTSFTFYSQKLNTNVHVVSYPIFIGDSKQAWSLALAIPMKHIVEQSNTILTSAIFVSVFATLFLILVIVLITRNLSQTITTMIDQTNSLVKAAMNGDLGVRGNPEKINHEFREIIININEALEAFTRPIQVTVNYLDKIAKGEIPPLITDTYKGNFNHIKNNLNQCVSSINSLVNSSKEFIEYAKAGHLRDLSFDETKFEGAYREIIGGMNIATLAITKPLTEVLDVLGRVANGDLSNSIKGDYQGGWHDLKEKTNQLIDVSKLIVQKSKQLSQGDLTVELKKRSENDELIEALNTMIRTISLIISELKLATNNISSASQQMSGVAQGISQGASEQATASEQVSASMEEISASINQNSENAQITEQMASKVSTDIEVANQAFESTISAMKEIMEKAEIIGEIADRTDLLAINAAIEAARAGELGKGFAVVASEIRKLAESSQQASNQIDKLSKSCQFLAENSAQKLERIIPDVRKTSQLVKEIAATSTEQNTGAIQVNSAIIQLNQVTQQNAAASEEMSTGAEELSSQSEQLKEIMEYFITKEDVIEKNPLKKKNVYPHREESLKNKGFNIEMDKDLDTTYEKY